MREVCQYAILTSPFRDAAIAIICSKNDRVTCLQKAIKDQLFIIKTAFRSAYPGLLDHSNHPNRSIVTHTILRQTDLNHHPRKQAPRCHKPD